MKNVRVLLVDDNERFLVSIGRYLASLRDLDIITAGKAMSGEEAIKLSAQLKPDLILMDLTMPRLNGLAATRVIKQKADAPRVIILTIHDSDEYKKAAREAGADGFVTKSEFAETLVPLVLSLFPQS
jgi:two-component system response regulator NreC